MASPVSPTVLHTQVAALVKEYQQIIVHQLEELDGKPFRTNLWTRPDGGQGISCVLENGNIFERGAVNISNITHGTMTGPAAAQMRQSHSLQTQQQTESHSNLPYSAVGLSIILHPKNPMAPTVHMNIRHLTTFTPEGQVSASWFGGGADLTPCYIFNEDATHFHRTLKLACDAHNPSFYPDFKRWCDTYFWNTHRDEARGIGGIFFDNLGQNSAAEGEKTFAFVRSVVQAFLPAYLPLVTKRKDSTYTPAQKEWQQLRRGRYVEFNLLHDRGTKFGLAGETPRVESILMSLPATAAWKYDFVPEEGSEEERLVQILRVPREWVE